MAILTFTYDTGNIPVSRILSGFAKTHGYQDQVPSADPENPNQLVPNPETKAQFCKRQVKRLIIEGVLNAEQMDAIASAQAAVVPIDLQ